jgi:hypothetical protein
MFFFTTARGIGPVYYHMVLFILVNKLINRDWPAKQASPKMEMSLKRLIDD